jgi:hypothetical protein
MSGMKPSSIDRWHFGHWGFRCGMGVCSDQCNLLNGRTMGINMLIAHDIGAGAAETRIQTNAALPK